MMLHPMPSAQTDEQVVFSTEIEELTEEETKRLKGYAEIYRTTHPLPAKKILSFSKTLGLEAAALAMTSLGGVVLAAIRTGGIFLVAEELVLQAFNITSPLAQGLTSILPPLAMLSALFAVEGYLVAIGLARGRESQKTNTSAWGLIFAFGISSVAGVVSSLPILHLDQTSVWSAALYWILVILSGVGATVLAYLGAHNIGVIRNKFDALIEVESQRYQSAMHEWYTNLQKDYRNRGRSAIFGMEKYTGGTKEVKANQPDIHVTKLVIDWLKANSLTPFDVGSDSNSLTTPAKIAAALNLEDSGSVRVALSRLRKKWQLITKQE